MQRNPARFQSLPNKKSAFIEPIMDCLPVAKLPEGPQWLWEITVTDAKSSMRGARDDSDKHGSTEMALSAVLTLQFVASFTQRLRITQTVAAASASKNHRL
jgi:hypothetical protein